MSVNASSDASIQGQAAAPAVDSAGQQRTPLGFIVDEESSIRHFMSLILQGTGIDTMEFATGRISARRGPRVRPT